METYSYDAKTQLETESRSGTAWWSRGYTYDKAGNLTHLTKNDQQGQDESDWLCLFNRVSVVDWGAANDWSVSYGYDVGGAHKDDGAVSSFNDGVNQWSYAYDDENRLTLVMNGTEPKYQCWYDAFGRPSKEVFNNTPSTTRYLVWDGDELQYEVNPSGLVIVRYVWGPTGLLGYYNSESGTATRVVLRDGLGHVRALMNTSRTLTDGFLYDAYGNDMNAGLHNTTEGNNLRFRWNGAYGYRTLPGTNVLHVGARHYSPQLRRWLQRDAITIASGSPNLYFYCENDPLQGADPDGLTDRAPTKYEQALIARALQLIGKCNSGPFHGLADEIRATHIVFTDHLPDKRAESEGNSIRLLSAFADVGYNARLNKRISMRDWTCEQWAIFQEEVVRMAALLVHENHHLRHQLFSGFESAIMQELAWIGIAPGGLPRGIATRAVYEREAWGAETAFLKYLAFRRPDLQGMCEDKCKGAADQFQRDYGMPLRSR